MHSQQGQSLKDKIVDFSKCPDCGSADIREVSAEEYARLTAQATAQVLPQTVPVVSVADELKKFKELLDLDIITREEFDAKKKQLLGL